MSGPLLQAARRTHALLHSHWRLFAPNMATVVSVSLGWDPGLLFCTVRKDPDGRCEVNYKCVKFNDGETVERATLLRVLRAELPEGTPAVVSGALGHFKKLIRHIRLRSVSYTAPATQLAPGCSKATVNAENRRPERPVAHQTAQNVWFVCSISVHPARNCCLA